MEKLAFLIGVFISLLFLLALPMAGSKAEQEKARARRIADAKMNARLLRFNL